MNKINRMKIAGWVPFIPLLVFALTGCNFFTWATPQTPGMSSQEFVSRGEEYFRRKNYAESLVNFQNALVIDNKNTKARLGCARAKLWLCFPDLVLMITKKMETVPNGVEAVIDVLNSQEGKDFLSRVHNTSDFLDIVGVIDSPNGIINDQGDGVVKSESMEANQYLLICYLSVFFIHFLDSNQDGVFGMPPDYCVLSNGNLAFRFELSGMLSNIMASTNITNGMSRTDALNTLNGSHDSCESILHFCSFIYKNIDYTMLALSAALRPATFLKQMNTNNVYPKGGQYTSYYEEFRDAATNTNANSSITPIVKELFWLKRFPDFVGVEMNAMHQVTVGVPGYTGNIGNFDYTLWNNHNGGLKAVIEASGPTIDSTTSGIVVSNVLDSLTHSELDEMLKL